MGWASRPTYQRRTCTSACQSMRKEQRLRKARDFAAARSEGRSYADNLLVLVARPNKLDVTRFGFSVGRKVGKAVARNKIKRRLREAARFAPVEAGWDLVLIARRDASSADFQALRSSVMSLLERGRVPASSPEGPSSSRAR